jgi:chromosome segregation ATPase
MEIKRTYSLVDIAERLRRPRTTLADWARQFREFLPTVGSGRTMRYTEEAVEVFGLISKMKDANEPPEYIKEQLRGVVSEIVVPMADNDNGKPYLMHLAGELNQIKQAMAMLAEQIQTLATVSEETRQDLQEARWEISAAAEKLSRKIEDMSNIFFQDKNRKTEEQIRTIEQLYEIRKGQQETWEQLDEILSRVNRYGKQRRGLLGKLFSRK